MPIRTKGRCRFTVNGRDFVWWLRDECILKVASVDKKFAASYPLGGYFEDPTLLAVSGYEFSGIDRCRKRPVWIVAPEYGPYSFGEFTALLVNWSLHESHERVVWDGPPVPPWAHRIKRIRRPGIDAACEFLALE